MTKDNVSHDEKQTPSSSDYPEARTTSGNNYILDFLPIVFSWHFSEGEGDFHEDTSCSHALKSQKQRDCPPSATTS